MAGLFCGAGPHRSRELPLAVDFGYSGAMPARPQWRAPFKPYPKDNANRVNDAMLARRSSFGDFSPANGRRQCEATARSTGARCHNDCVRFASTCRVHKGIRAAYAKAKAFDSRVVRSKPAPSRRALAALGFGHAPDGLDMAGIDVGPMRRGALFEAFRNRELDPETWKRMCECLNKNR